MQMILEAIQSIRVWQAAVLCAVVLLGAGGTYGAYMLVSDPDPADLDEDQQLVPVQRGDLINEVSVSGNLVYPNRESLTFGIQGTVGVVIVDDGQSVSEGDPLVTLDDVTVATLEKAVARAKVNLKAAEDALADSLKPYTDLDVAQAEANVSNARLSIRKAEDAMAALVNTNFQELTQAEASVINARLSIRRAEDAMATLVDTNSQDIARAKAAVVDAKISVRDTIDALQSLISGPTDDELEKILSQITSAETSLASVKIDVKLDQKSWEDNLALASQEVEDKKEVYAAVFNKWLGIELNAQQIGMDPDSLLESWDTDLDTIFSHGYVTTGLDRGPFGLDLPDDDPNTPWHERVIYLWINFHPGKKAITCPDGDLSGTVCVSKELGDAWNAYEDSIDKLDDVQLRVENATANNELTITRHEDEVAALRDTLIELQTDADVLDVERGQRQVDLATAALQSEEEDLTNLLAGPEQIEMDSKQKDIDLAKATLQSEEEDLADLLAGPEQMEMDSKQKDVDLARLMFERSEESLAELLSGADPLDVALSEADLTSAIAALEEATQQLDVVVVKAPWDGIVSAVYVESGQTVNPNIPLLEMIDPSIIEVDGIVDEIDVLFIQEGASASVTLDALAGQILSGTVSEIAAEATSNQGVVSYPMRIQVEAPAGVDLPEGLSAVASVVIREDRDVLLVPLDALYGTFERPVVLVMNGKVEERPVVLGNSDDFWVVIQDGLTESEMIVMEASQASDTGGFGGLRGLFVGSHSGGFRGAGGGSGGWQGGGGSSSGGGGGSR